MDMDPAEAALARIEAALARMEHLAGRPPAPADADLPARHARLRAEVAEALGQLDALIASRTPGA